MKAFIQLAVLYGRCAHGTVGPDKWLAVGFGGREEGGVGDVAPRSVTD